MKRHFFFILLFSTLSFVTRAQFKTIELLPTEGATIKKATLSATDGKRCRIFNVLSNATDDKSPEHAPVLIAIKVFYDSSETQQVFIPVDKDSLSITDKTSTKDLMRYYSFRLQSNADKLISGTGSQPQIYVLSCDQLLFEENANYFLVKDAIIYIDAYLLFDFIQNSPLQSSMNLINTTALMMHSIPDNHAYAGKNYLTSKKDGIYRFHTYLPIIDDGLFDARMFELNYKPGFGIIAFKTQVRPFIKPRRMHDPSFQIDRSKSRPNWDKDVLYEFWPVDKID